MWSLLTVVVAVVFVSPFCCNSFHLLSTSKNNNQNNHNNKIHHHNHQNGGRNRHRCYHGQHPIPTRRSSSSFSSLSSSTSTNNNNNSLILFASVSDNNNENEKEDSILQQKQKHVIVVGGGVGGLAIASRILASSSSSSSSTPNGYRVTIIEKNSNVGGRCGSFTRRLPEGTFRHERGPSLLLLPDVYKSIFEECSTPDGKSSIGDYGLNLKQCIPAYQVVFEDGDTLNVGYPRNKRDARMCSEELESRNQMNKFEIDGAMKWDEYMKVTSAFLDCGLPNFIEEKFDILSFPAFLIEALRDYCKCWPLKPHSDVLDLIFESEKMKALASFQDLYVGLEPFRNNEKLGGGVLTSTSPAVFGLLAAIELHPSNTKSGVFAPIGGFQSVTNALEKLTIELGTTIITNKTVSSIQNDGVYIIDTKQQQQHSNNNKEEEEDEDAVVDAEFLPADLIVVNADLPYATKSLFSTNDDNDNNDNEDDNNSSSSSRRIWPSPSSADKNNKQSKVVFDWDDKFSYSSGVISFHWSIKNKVCDDLNTHNVFMVAGSRSQAELSWKILRENDDGDDSKEVFGEPFNFYVHRPTKTDPTAAPSGCDSIMILVPCWTLLRDADCAKLPREEAIRRYKAQFDDVVVSQVRESVLRRLAVIESLKDLQDYIIDEVVDTPGTWADQFHLAAGTPFALSHGFAQLSLARPGPAYLSSNNKGKYPNVLFCGASTRPGNGVPLVLIGAKQVAAKAISKLRDEQRKEEEDDDNEDEDESLVEEAKEEESVYSNIK